MIKYLVIRDEFYRGSYTVWIYTIESDSSEHAIKSVRKYASSIDSSAISDDYVAVAIENVTECPTIVKELFLCGG